MSGDDGCDLHNHLNGDVPGTVVQVGQVHDGIHVYLPPVAPPMAHGGAVTYLGTVADMSMFAMGVHRAPHVTGAVDDGAVPESLPAYVERPHDVRLRAALARAAEQGAVDVPRMVVLTGESSVGKTRALVEAARAVLPDWHLVVPATAAELVALASGGLTRPRSAVWLDEAQRFFDGPDGAGAARALSRLLTGDAQVVALATMWTEPYWHGYTALGRLPDTHADVRDLLTGFRSLRLHVPDRLDPDTLAGFADSARHDARVAAALAAGKDDGRVIQHLTGGPELLEAFLHHGTFTPVEHALITVAIDTRNLGHFSPIPTALLTAAADGYLDPRHRPGTHDELDAALTDVVRGWRNDGTRTDVRRTVTALSEMRQHVGARAACEPDDYLVQHKAGQRPEPVPGSLWHALVHHTEVPEDRLRLGQVAASRGLRRIAFALMEPVAASRQAPPPAARRVVRTGRQERAGAGVVGTDQLGR